MSFLALLSLLLMALPTTPAGQRYLLYLHPRIVEDQGRLPTDPAFGVYQFDAILDSLRQRGFTVLSDQRGPKASSDSAATRVTQQVDSLLRLGISPEAISVVGFSKGGWIAILASTRLRNPAVRFVFLGACGPWSNDPTDLHVAGHLLSLYEKSDSLGVSCAPLLGRRGAGSDAEEIELDLGLEHGTFFQPRAAWLDPVTAWIR